ncbi:hypothetical protein PM082_019044 [Marasmius tenuissimus]|nr:hypothetical protein PM082_019044 [Marasmius tenuissimus]
MNVETKSVPFVAVVEDAPPTTRLEKFTEYLKKEATFFRVHLLAFTFIPLIVSGIFYGCNGRFPVGYLDSLFLCYSAMTVTGLSTVNLSTLTAWQQVILYLLMIIGDITIVSWIMVLVRKHYFKTRCEFEYVNRRKESATKTLLSTISHPVAMFKAREPVPPRRNEFISNVIGATPSATMNYYPTPSSPSDERGNQGEGILSDDQTFTSSPRAASIALSPRSPVGVEFAHTTSITPSVARRRRLNTIREGVPMPYRSATIMTQRALPHTNTLTNEKKYQDNGGFPGPIELANRLIQRMAPRTYRKLERKMTMPYTQTLEKEKTKWLNFDLDVGRNSNFRIDELTDEQLEEIGGVEYMALRYLSYLVPLYFIFTQVIAYLVFAPWISTTDQYDDVFDAQPRVVKKPWFALFQVMGAYTGGGLSLVDMGMVPFQNAYLMTLSLIFVILAGNHALVGHHLYGLDQECLEKIQRRKRRSVSCSTIPEGAFRSVSKPPNLVFAHRTSHIQRNRMDLIRGSQHRISTI